MSRTILRMASMIGRLAVRREPHDLVLVAVMRKAEILRQRLIEDAERVREIDPPFDRNLSALADAPRGAREVAKTIDRHDDRLLERRNVERRRQMREMMLDRVHFTLETLAGKACRQQFRIS